VHVDRHARGILQRVLYLAKLRSAALERYDRGDSPDRIRASVVAKDVATVMDVENSPVFRADLTQALRAAGWRSVKVDNVRLWKGVRRR